MEETPRKHGKLKRMMEQVEILKRRKGMMIVPTEQIAKDIAKQHEGVVRARQREDGTWSYAVDFASDRFGDTNVE